MTPNKFTIIQQAEAQEWLENHSSVYITTPEEFIKEMTPSELAHSIKSQNLSLDYEYIRSDDYGENCKEADTVAELITDEEIEEALIELNKE